jgi:hypothetical protein
MGWVEDKIVDPILGGVSDVVEWTIDEVIDPVVNTVEQVIEGMLDNPVKTIAQVAAIVTQNYWALPLIEGADVAAKGGDIEDVAKAVAVSYVTQKIATPVAKEVSSAAAAAGAGEATAAILGQASASSAVAIVRGQDPVEAFIRGGVTAAVPAALGEVEAFSELPAPAQNVLAASVTAALTGQDVGIAAINSAVASINVGSKVLKELDPDKKMTPQQSAIAAQMINRITSSALTGTNPSAAVQSALINVGVKELGNKLDDQVQEWADSLKLGVDGLEIKSKEVSELQTQYETAHGEWVSLANEFNGRLATVQTKEAEVERLRTVYNGNKTEANANALNAAIRDYNTITNSFNADYASKYKDQLAYYEKYVPSLENRINIAVGEYDDMSDIVEDSSNSIGEWMDQNYYATAQAFVGVMDPNFNPEEYRQINNIAEDEDVYEHWLTTGQFEGLRTNAAAAEGEILLERSRLLQDIAKETGVALSQITEEDIQRLSKLMMDTYGLDLTRLKAATAGTFSEDTQIPFDDLLQEIKTDKEVLQTKPYGDWNKPPDYTPPTGYNLATADDVANNRSIQVMAPNGIPVWLTPGRIEGWDPVVGDTDTPLRIDINGVGDANVTDPTADSSVNITPSSPPPTFDNLFEVDPLSWMTITQELPPGALTTIDKTLLDVVQGGVTLIEKAGASEGTLTLVGNILKGTGQVFQSFGGLVAAIGQNPNDSRLYNLGKGIVDIGAATTSEEYQAAIKSISKMVGDAKGVKETFFAVLKAARDYPVEFASEYLGVEALSEIVPLLIGGGAAKVTEGYLLAQGMGKALAERAAAKVGVSTAIASDVLESAGGSAANAFEETFKVAREQGLSEEDATKAALEVASKTATIAAITTLGANKLGAAALEKFMLGDKALGTADALTPYEKIQDFITTGGAITIKEGVSAGGQEGIIQGYLEGQLYQFDPTRDVAGNITAATTFGGISGGGVAGGVYTGAKGASLVGNAMKGNAEVQDIVSQEWGSQAELAKALTDFTGIANVTIPYANSSITTSIGGQSTLVRSKFSSLGFLSQAGYLDINMPSSQLRQLGIDFPAGQGPNGRLDSEQYAQVQAQIDKYNTTLALSRLQEYIVNPVGTQMPSTPLAALEVGYNVNLAPQYSLSPTGDFTMLSSRTGAVKPKNESSEENSIAILNMGMGYADVLKSYFGDQVLNTQDLIDLADKNNLNTSDRYINSLINSLYTPISFDPLQVIQMVNSVNPRFASVKDAIKDGAQSFADGNRSIQIKELGPDGRYKNTILDFKSPYKWEENVTETYDPTTKKYISTISYTPSPVETTPEDVALNNENALKYLTFVSENRNLSVDKAMQKLKEYGNLQNLYYTTDPVTGVVTRNVDSSIQGKYFINVDALSDAQKLEFTERLNATLDEQPLYVTTEDVTSRLVALSSLGTGQAGVTPDYGAVRYGPSSNSSGVINKLSGALESAGYHTLTNAGQLQDFVADIAITTPIKIFYDITSHLGDTYELSGYNREPLSEKYDNYLKVFAPILEGFPEDPSRKVFSYAPGTNNLGPVANDTVLKALSNLTWDQTYDFLDQAFPGFSTKFPKDTITKEAFKDTAPGSMLDGNSLFSQFVDSKFITGREVYEFVRDNPDKFLGDFNAVSSLVSFPRTNENEIREFADPLVNAYVKFFKDIEVPPDHPDYENEVLKKLPEFYNKAFIADQELDEIFKDLNYKNIVDPETRAMLSGSVTYINESTPDQVDNFIDYVDFLYDISDALQPPPSRVPNPEPFTPENVRKNVLELIDSRVNKLRDEVTSYYDPLALDRSEIIDVLKQEGITDPTDEQIQPFLDAEYENEAAGISAVQAFADPISVTPDEVREQLLAAGYTNIDDSEIEQFAKFLPESEVFPTIAAYARDKTFSREEAIEFYNQLGFTPTEEQIQQFVKQGKDVNKDAIRYEMSEYVDPLYVTPDEVREQYEILGFGKPTDADITKFIGQRLESEIPDVLKDYLPTAQYNSISQEFQEYKTQAEQAAAAQQSLIGAQGRDVTQEDLLAIRDIIAQQQANPDTQLTPEQLAYDANRDGKIDTADQLFLTTYLQQTTQGGAPEFKPPPGSIWAPTGLYEQIANLQNQVASGGSNQQLAQQTQAALRTSQQRQNVSQLYNFLQMEPGFGPSGGAGTGQVKAPDPAKIGYIYDWSSIFANPQQERMFISPYAEGGAVEYEVTDELLKILRG